MQGVFRGHAGDVAGGLKKDGLEYAVSIGRRAPMHRIHLECINEIAEAGLKPVIFIGSTNGADSAWFDPVKNPLTLEQQKEQLKSALGGAVRPGAHFNPARCGQPGKMV